MRHGSCRQVYKQPSLMNSGVIWSILYQTLWHWTRQHRRIKQNDKLTNTKTSTWFDLEM